MGEWILLVLCIGTLSGLCVAIRMFQLRWPWRTDRLLFSLRMWPAVVASIGGLATVFWVGEKTFWGGGSVHLSALVGYSLPLYALAEARAARIKHDARNLALWGAFAVGGMFTTTLGLLGAWACQAIELHPMFAISLMSAAWVLALVRLIAPALEHNWPGTIERAGQPLDRMGLAMLGVGHCVALVIQWASSTWKGSWAVFHPPKGFELTAGAGLWAALAVYLILNVRTIYAALFQAADLPHHTLWMLALIPSVLLGVPQLSWGVTDSEAWAYQINFVVWATAALMLWPCVLHSPNSSGRRMPTLVILSLGLGTGLVPGNIWNLSQAGHGLPAVYAYVVNNSMLSMALYAWLNGLGARSYLLRNLKDWWAFKRNRTAVNSLTAVEH